MTEDPTAIITGSLPPLTGDLGEENVVSARQLIDEAKSDPRFIERKARIDAYLAEKARRMESEGGQVDPL